MGSGRVAALDDPDANSTASQCAIVLTDEQVRIIRAGQSAIILLTAEQAEAVTMSQMAK